MQIKRETRIQREYDKLTELYALLPDNKKKLVQPLLQNAAFIKVTLEDLQEQINKEGTFDQYKNGENQFGRKPSANLQAYTSLAKNYAGLIEKLEKMLPKESRHSALSELINE